jgi:hypothetical protein
MVMMRVYAVENEGDLTVFEAVKYDRLAVIKPNNYVG